MVRNQHCRKHRVQIGRRSIGHPHAGILRHRFLLKKQCMPVVAGDPQSMLVHAQDAELAEDPSDTEHAGILLHGSCSSSSASLPRAGRPQTTRPQAQAAVLEHDPSDTAELKCLLHRFSDCLQNMPVVLADSQFTLPHAQAAALAEDPSNTAHAESCGTGSCSSSSACLWSRETHNPRCRMRRMQSWQKIHQTPSMQESCGTGSAWRNSSYQWSRETHNPRCRMRRMQSWQKIHRTPRACRNLAALAPAQVPVLPVVARLTNHTATSTGFRVGSRSVNRKTTILPCYGTSNDSIEHTTFGRRAVHPCWLTKRWLVEFTANENTGRRANTTGRGHEGNRRKQHCQLYKTRDCLLLQTCGALTGGQQTRHSLSDIDVTLATSHSFNAWLNLLAE